MDEIVLKVPVINWQIGWYWYLLVYGLISWFVVAPFFSRAMYREMVANNKKETATMTTVYFWLFSPLVFAAILIFYPLSILVFGREAIHGK